MWLISRPCLESFADDFSALAASALALSPAEGLKPPYQALLTAAAAEEDDAIFTNAVSALALTRSAERIAAGAARISHRHGVTARRILGLPMAPVTPAPEPAVIAVETDAARDTALAAKRDPFWIAAPASAVELISRAHSELWTGKVRLGVRYISEVDNGDYLEGAFDLLSDMELQLSETMRLESETRLLASNSARADHLFRMNTDLGELWSLEVRYRYEFDPEPGFEAGDSRTDLALIREF